MLRSRGIVNHVTRQTLPQGLASTRPQAAISDFKDSAAETKPKRTIIFPTFHAHRAP